MTAAAERSAAGVPDPRLPGAPGQPVAFAQVVRLRCSATGQVVTELMVPFGVEVQVLPVQGAAAGAPDDVHEQRLRMVRAMGHSLVPIPERMPRCMGRLAELAGVSRPTFTASVVLALRREAGIKRGDGLRLLAEAATASRMR